MHRLLVGSGNNFDQNIEGNYRRSHLVRSYPRLLEGCHWRIGGHTPDLSENWPVETRHGASLHLAE
ncbi:MAG: hypothetical protein F6J86_08385 [Symploca sp. SIO1B1]|nr:hypothetical protein [Symploca sp. SIO1B1]